MHAARRVAHQLQAGCAHISQHLNGVGIGLPLTLAKRSEARHRALAAFAAHISCRIARQGQGTALHTPLGVDRQRIGVDAPPVGVQLAGSVSDHLHTALGQGGGTRSVHVHTVGREHAIRTGAHAQRLRATARGADVLAPVARDDYGCAAHLRAAVRRQCIDQGRAPRSVYSARTVSGDEPGRRGIDQGTVMQHHRVRGRPRAAFAPGQPARCRHCIGRGGHVAGGVARHGAGCRQARCRAGAAFQRNTVGKQRTATRGEPRCGVVGNGQPGGVQLRACHSEAVCQRCRLLPGREQQPATRLRCVATGLHCVCAVACQGDGSALHTSLTQHDGVGSRKSARPGDRRSAVA